MRVHYPKLRNIVHTVLLLPKDQTFINILFAITAAGVVPSSGPKNSPRTSSLEKIIFYLGHLRSDIQSVQNTHV